MRHINDYEDESGYYVQDQVWFDFSEGRRGLGLWTLVALDWPYTQGQLMFYRFAKTGATG